jgi:hypothetical protein
LRTQGEKTVAGASPDVKARIEAAIKGAKVNEMSFLGVLAEDSNACYSALPQKIETEVGTAKTQVTLSAVTAVKGKAVFYYLYTVYQSADTVTAALARHRKNVAALLAANGG